MNKMRISYSRLRTLVSSCERYIGDVRGNGFYPRDVDVYVILREDGSLQAVSDSEWDRLEQLGKTPW